MSYPRQYGMPMPQQYPSGSSYPGGYGQQPAGGMRQPYHQPYQGNTRPPYPVVPPIRSTQPHYPPQSSATSQPHHYPAQPRASTQPPYPSYSSAATQPPYPAHSSAATEPPYPARSSAATQPPYPARSSTNSQPPYPTAGVQSMSVNNYSNTAPSTTTPQVHSEIDQWSDSAAKTLISHIKDATKSELEQVVNNEDKIIELVQDTEQVKKLQQKRENLNTENNDLALTNLSMEPELEQLREQLMTLAAKQNELKEKYTQLQSGITGKVSLDGMLAILQAETSQSDSESEQISKEFVSSDEAGDNIDPFIEMYMNKRIEYHLRKVKCDKMIGLIARPAQNTAAPVIPQRQPMPAPRRNMAPMGGYGYGGY